jgi:hypothetical protein
MSNSMNALGVVDTSHLQDYKYRPIRHKDSIRIIHLDSSVDDNAPITFKILQSRLSDVKLEYEALSYTWGAQYPKQRAFCRNPPSALEVTQNCYSALRRLRNDSVRQIWIDAICINQEDNDERGAQVRMMDRIYARASQVIVDLGEETPGCRLLFTELMEADKSKTQTGEYMRPRPSDRIIEELECLYRRPWFSRIWVVQEVVANSNVTIMCGASQSSWSALLSCDYGFKNTRVTVEDPPILRIKRRSLRGYRYLNGLWRILVDTRALFASDPRDRVFAVLSLLGSNLDIKDQLVDYNQSTEAIFIKVGKLLLSNVGLRLLTVLRYGHHREMPTWIPDWSQNDYFDWYSFRGFDRGGGVDPLNTSCFEILSVGKYSCALKVKGFRFGTIICLSPTFSWTSLDDAQVTFFDLCNLFHKIKSEEHLLPHEIRISLPPDLLAGKCSRQRSKLLRDNP